MAVFKLRWLLPVLITAIFVGVGIHGYYQSQLRAIEPENGLNYYASQVGENIANFAADTFSEVMSQPDQDGFGFSGFGDKFFKRDSDKKLDNTKGKNIIDELFDYLGDNISPCVEVTVKARITARTYNLYGRSFDYPERQFVNIKVTGTIKIRYLDRECNIKEFPTIKIPEISLNFEIIRGEFILINQIPPEAKRVGVPITFYKTWKFGSIDKDKCPRCKEPEIPE